ncbi:hypothetical protein [Flavobacterium sp.]|uniref:hypothetical protein n=1 Tax=Flavobacterium sp. TaxID=239 RepID=UPI002609624B|nr:hypothetical protein [Flavobacterium sp.]
MKQCTTLMLLLFASLATAQNSGNEHSVKMYRYGYNGMELIATSSKETIIVSTYNSKLSIKEDIAQKVFHYYWDNLRNHVSEPVTVTIEGENAKVTGKCVVIKKGKLTAVEFHFEKIEWPNGIIEVHRMYQD